MNKLKIFLAILGTILALALISFILFILIRTIQINQKTTLEGIPKNDEELNKLKEEFLQRNQDNKLKFFPNFTAEEFLKYVYEYIHTPNIDKKNYTCVLNNKELYAQTISNSKMLEILMKENYLSDSPYNSEISQGLIDTNNQIINTAITLQRNKNIIECNLPITREILHSGNSCGPEALLESLRRYKPNLLYKIILDLAENGKTNTGINIKLSETSKKYTRNSTNLNSILKYEIVRNQNIFGNFIQMFSNLALTRPKNLCKWLESCGFKILNENVNLPKFCELIGYIGGPIYSKYHNKETYHSLNAHFINYSQQRNHYDLVTDNLKIEKVEKIDSKNKHNGISFID